MSRETPRLVDQSPMPGSSAERLRDLIARQAGVDPLSPAQLARVRRAVASRAEAGPSWTIVAWAAAGAIVVATTSMGWAQDGSLGARLRDAGKRAVAAMLPASLGGRQARPRERPPLVLRMPASSSHEGLPPLPPVPTLAPPATEAERAQSGVAAPARPASSGSMRAPTAVGRAGLAPPLAPVPIAVSPPPDSPSALALEAANLREVARLLQAGDPAQALRELVVYRRRFPAGALAEEADLAELNADVALDRRAEAIGLLARLERPGGPRPAELRLLHGELLARGGDCTGALAWWGDALPTDPALAERTLYGRASCFAALGRTAESRAAMTAYLSAFPHGRFAATVRAALAPLAPTRP